MALVGNVLGLAVADSVNPFAIGLVVNALASHRAARPAVVYTAVTMVLNIGVGLTVLAGLRGLGDAGRGSAAATAGVALGLALVGWGVWSLVRSRFGRVRRSEAVPPLVPARPLGAAAVATLATAVSLPFAGQFLLALSWISQADLPLPVEALLLAAYSLVFTLPLWALVALRLARRRELGPEGLHRLAVVGDALLVAVGLLMVATAWADAIAVTGH